MRTQRGVTIAGRCSTSCRVISHEMPPLPTMMPALSTVTGVPPLAEEALDLAATAQMRRQLVALAPQSPQVDDLPTPASAAASPNAWAASASKRSKSFESSE